MPPDVREEFERRRAKVTRSLRSGDYAAFGRMDSLLVEMSRVLGDEDPDTLLALLDYVHEQLCSTGGTNAQWRSTADLLDSFSRVFGESSSEVARARFYSLLEKIHFRPWWTWDPDTGRALLDDDAKDQQAAFQEAISPELVASIAPYVACSVPCELVSPVAEAVRGFLVTVISDDYDVTWSYVRALSDSDVPGTEELIRLMSPLASDQGRNTSLPVADWPWLV